MIVRPSIVAGSSGTTPSSGSRDDHPARMLAEMPWEIEIRAYISMYFADAEIVREIETRFIEPFDALSFESLDVRNAESISKAVRAIPRRTRKPSHLARSGPSAISDHVRRHPRTTAAVFLIDVLDHAFAVVAGRKVDVDIGILVRSSERNRSKKGRPRSDRPPLSRVRNRPPNSPPTRVPVREYSCRSGRNSKCPKRAGNIPQASASRSGLIRDQAFAFTFRSTNRNARSHLFRQAFLRKRIHRFVRRHRIIGKGVAKLVHREIRYGAAISAVRSTASGKSSNSSSICAGISDNARCFPR